MSIEDQVRSWLARRNTGCWFAALLATESKRDRLAMATFPDAASPDQIDPLFDYAGGKKLPALAIILGVRTESELVDQLLLLTSGSRWSVRRVPVPLGMNTDDVLVGIEWATTGGTRSSPMGFATLGTMPVTRRAPFTCIAGWTGGHDNVYRKKTEPVVHFLDADLTGVVRDARHYSSLTTKSVKETTAMLANENDHARNYRNVAFRLSSAASAALHDLATLEA
jgi:hypothetical protein